MRDDLIRRMDKSPESIADRMTELRKRAGLTMEQMATEMGYAGASSIQRYFSPNDLKPGYLKRDLVAAVERAVLGKGEPPIQKPEIWELAGPEFASTLLDAPNAIVGSQIFASGNMIPVYGSAVGGVYGEFQMNGTLLYEVMAPPSLAGNTKAYAVQVSGDSMEPRYFDGEVVYVDPTRRVVRGNFVVAQIKVDDDGPPLAYIKRFIRHNAEELVLHQYNPEKELKFPHDSVESVHCVVMGGMG